MEQRTKQSVKIILGCLLPMTLRDTLGDPDHVATLLLLQLQQRVEHPVVELLQERVDVQLHLDRCINS